MAIIIDLVKIATLVLSVTGSYFWIRRNVWSSARSISELCKTKWDFHKELAQELCGQRADSLIAWTYISLSAFAQAVLFFVPVERPFASPLRPDPIHFFYLAIMAVATLILGNWASRNLEGCLMKKVMSYENLNDK